MSRIQSVDNRLRAFTLLEVLVVLGILAVLISMIRLDTGAALTRLTDNEARNRVEIHIRDAIFQSVISPRGLISEYEIPGCEGLLVSLAGGYFRPARLTCGHSQFRVSATGELSSDL